MCWFCGSKSYGLDATSRSDRWSLEPKLYLPGILKKLDDLEAEVKLLQTKADNLEKANLITFYGVHGSLYGTSFTLAKVIRAIVNHLKVNVSTEPAAEEKVVLTKWRTK